MTYKNNILFLKIFMVSALAIVVFCGRPGTARPDLEKAGAQTGEKAEDVSAVEDLMREHGLLDRILLIYDKVLRDTETGPAPSCGVLFKAASITRDFMENYHEKLEEDYVFPRLEKTGPLTDLVKVLREQHQAGRRLTGVILEISKPGEIDRPSGLPRLRNALRSFVAMYRPHKAREDTTLFPALHANISQKEYAELGGQFEAREHQLFGRDGFENMVRAVGQLEQELNIYNLAGFTPKIEN